LLTQVSAALSTSLDLDRTLKEILERMNALVAFDAATVFMLDDSQTELHVKAALGVPVSLTEVKSFKVGEGVVGWVVRHGTTALIQDSSKDARYKPTGPERRPKTVLAAPLRAQDHLLGALVLVRAAKEPFGPEHQRLVEAIASQAAVAIDHARLFETERGSRRRAEALLATAQACSEAVALPELLQTRREGSGPDHARHRRRHHHAGRRRPNHRGGVRWRVALIARPAEPHRAARGGRGHDAGGARGDGPGDEPA